ALHGFRGDHRAARRGVQHQRLSRGLGVRQLADLLVRNIPVSESSAGSVDESLCILGRRSAFEPMKGTEGEEIFFLGRDELRAVDLEEWLTLRHARPDIVNVQSLDPSGYL